MEKIYRGLSLTADIPENITVGQYIYESLINYENNDALICAITERTLKYSDVLDQSLRIATVFREYNVTADDAVAVISENSLDYLTVVIGTFFLGSTTAPINPTYVDRELEHCLLISTPKIIVCSVATIEKVVPVVEKLVAEGKLGNDTETFVIGKASMGIDLIEQAAKINYISRDLPVSIPNPQNKTSFLMCSSGTTGLPKGVELTNFNYINAIESMRMPGMLPQDPSYVFTGLLPFFHAYGLQMGIFPLLFGGKLVIFPRFKDEVFLSAIEKFKVTHAMLVPPLVIFLAKSPLVLKYDLSSLLEIWSSAAPLGKEMEDAITNRFGRELIRQGYGLTETTLAVTLAPLGLNKAGSVGVLTPGVMSKVIDRDSGKTLAEGQSGELLFSSNFIMKGYKNNKQATDECIDSEGWFHTGDIGYYDNDGYMYIIDRLKELIKYKGFQVPPAELEALLLDNTEIQEAGVIGIPDEQAGELPFAFIVKTTGSNISEQDVIDYISERVSPAKRLHGGCKFVPSIPKTASGKVLRRELRALVNNSKL